MAMTYNQAIEFLYSQLPAYHRIGKAAYKNNLDNTLELDSYFGHPHKKYRTVHVAGTNGKGSVSHMTASVLQEAGYQTGLYTSPHLRDFRERIRVNGKMIPESEVVSFVKLHRDIIGRVNPSFFEMTVAMAFDFFARSGVEVAVIETGLGGRLDSTNIITPALSVITNIGHDHMDLLGDTLVKVAQEKAGIIKEGIPVVIGESQEETDAVFTGHADRKGSMISFADSNFRCTLDSEADRRGRRGFEVRDLNNGRNSRGITPLGGDYQARNIQTLFGLVRVTGKTFSINEENVLKGIRNCVVSTGLMGRWQILGKKPLIICDTGHNREGLGYVLRQLRRIPAKNLHIVLGFVSDKDISSILPMFPPEARYYFTKASVQRALDENTLAEQASGCGLGGSSYGTVKEALGAARRQASASDVIFVGGSTFIVAEVI